MVTAGPEYERPWWVVGPSFDGKSRAGFCRGHDDEEQAKADAHDRNRRAETLGIDAKYRVVPNPEKSKP